MQNMPMGPMQMNPGLQPGGLQSPMQQSPASLQQVQMQQAQMQAQQQQQQQEKLDNISKVKTLVGPLKESLSTTLKTAALALHQNSLIDLGTIKGNESTTQRFDKNLEEFYSYCDQMELNLKTAIECVTQGASSQRYLPMPVNLSRMESGPVVPQQETLSYPQFLNTSKIQVTYARELHDTLQAASQSLGSTD